MQARSIALVGAGLAGGVALALGLNTRLDTGAAQAQLIVPAQSRQVPQSAGEVTLSFAPVARAAQPSVVNIFTARVVRERGRMGPFFQTFESQPRVANSLGSGVIVDAAGLVVTNNHVVQGADQIVVALADRREYPARIVFAEPRLDLALLRLETSGAALPVARLGDSDRAQVGDLVLAIGNPFGVGQTVTQGIVSAAARTGIGISDTQFFIQTDAAINQGNSGGALLAMNGEVIGINTAILTGGGSGGSIGLGFAVPSNMVKSFLRAARTGKFVTAWIGAEGEALTTEGAVRAGLSRPTGMLLTGVSPGSPADRAGLRPGDIIAAIDGKEVTDPASLRYQIATQPLGERVSLTVQRDGRPRSVAIELAPPPENPPRQLTRLSAGSLFGGLAVANLSPALAQELGAGLPERGVVLVDVPQGSFLGSLVRRGDMIEEVNGREVRTVGELVAALGAVAPAEISFTINRFGQRASCTAVPGRGLGCRSVAPRFAGALPPGG